MRISPNPAPQPRSPTPDSHPHEVVPRAHEVVPLPHGIVSQAHDASRTRTKSCQLRTESSLTRTTHLARARSRVPSARSRLSSARRISHTHEVVPPPHAVGSHARDESLIRAKECGTERGHSCPPSPSQGIRPLKPKLPERDLGEGRILVLDGDAGPIDDWPVFSNN